jgi:hypothetical protein
MARHSVTLHGKENTTTTNENKGLLARLKESLGVNVVTKRVTQ